MTPAEAHGVQCVSWWQCEYREWTRLYLFSRWFDVLVNSSFASLGAAVVVLSFLYGPFIQQLVGYHDRLVPSGKEASIVRAQRYLAPSYEGLPLPSVVDLSMKVTYPRLDRFTTLNSTGCHLQRNIWRSESSQLKYRVPVLNWKVSQSTWSIIFACLPAKLYFPEFLLPGNLYYMCEYHRRH